MIDEGRQEKNWLIKSSTRILGPFTTDEVGQLLLKKHISIIDEIRQPIGRWKYIREHRIFDEMVQTLRAEQENANEYTQTQTMTQTMTSAQATGLHTGITRTDALHQLDNLTPTPTPIPPSSAPPLPQSDHGAPFGGDVKDINAREKTLAPGGLAGAYGHVRDRRFSGRIRETQSRVRWTIVGIAALFVLAVVLLQFRRGVKRDEGYDALIGDALRYRHLQIYEKALASYRRAIQIREADPATQSQMALVLIVFDRGQTLTGRRILERDLRDEHNGRAQIIDANLGIAMSYVLEGNLREAEETLQRVIVIEPQNFVARLNLALINLRKNDAKEALRQLDDMAARNPPHPLLLIARAVAMIESGASKDPLAARSLVNEIRNFMNRSSQLKQELLLVSAALLPSEDPTLPQLVSEFLMQLAHQSSLYVRDLRLDWRVVDWEFLERHCRDFAARFPSSARLKAMRAICLAESGHDTESRRLLDEALVEGPKDSLVLFTQANLFYRNGLRNEAYAILRLPELGLLTNREILIGKICLDQGDLACAERSFRSVLSSGMSLPAMAGLAAVLLKQEKRTDAMTLIREGLDQEPGYLPLIELREFGEAAE